MLYLVYGDQSLMIKNRLKKISKERLEFLDEINYVRYDANETLVQDVVDDANLTPLGYERKIIVLENCYFLSNARVKNKIDSDQNFAVLIKYLQSPNEATDLIFTVNSPTIDEKNDITKLIKANGKVFQLLSIDKKDWDAYVYKYFTESLNVKIDRDAISELTNRVQGDLNLFTNEAQKLALYKDHITYEDVCLLVSSPLEENAFGIFNYLLAGNNKSAISLFRDLQVSNVEPITLISMLGNQFRLLWQIVYLTKQGKSVEEIASILRIKDIRVKIMKRNAYTISMEDLQNTLDDLQDLDIKIKSGLVDRFYAFELFLIKFKVK